ncbi:MAG TPA: hypothetical protein VD886_10335, partial [Herpetosiphonaceae bacterium]|nr:hypothetical protein [Herpetosiphonaceae bacterium]
MLSLPSELDILCFDVFILCTEFDSSDNLRSVFSTDDLNPFINDIPGFSRNKRQYVSDVKLFLIQKELADGRPLMLPFLKALRINSRKEDSLHEKLRNLYQRMLAQHALNCHYICYTHGEGDEQAKRVHAALRRAGAPSCLEKRDPSDRYVPGPANEDPLSGCASMVLILASPAIDPQSASADEIARALSFKKPIISLRFAPDAGLPELLGSREVVDFTGPFDAALASLRRALDELTIPAGQLRELEYRLADAQRALVEAPGDQGIVRDITKLQAKITALQETMLQPEAPSTGDQPAKTTNGAISGGGRAGGGMPPEGRGVPRWLIIAGLLGAVIIASVVGLGIRVFKQDGKPSATPTVVTVPTGTASPTDAPAASTTPSVIPIPPPPDLPTATPDLPDPINIVSATPPGCDPGLRQNLEQTLESKLGGVDVTSIPNVGGNEPPETNVPPGTALIYIWWDCAQSTISRVSITFLAPPAYPIWLLHEVRSLSMPATLGDPQQLALGASQYALGNYDGARATLRSLADANTQSQGAGQIHWLVGNTLLHREQWSDAYLSYSYGIPFLSGGADGEQIKLLSNQALAALLAQQSGQNAEEMGCSTAQDLTIPKAEDSDPSNITIKVLDRMLLLACATELERDDVEKPIQGLASASGIAENDLPSVYLVQAYFHWLLGDGPEGKRLACSALKLNPRL